VPQLLGIQLAETLKPGVAFATIDTIAEQVLFNRSLQHDDRDDSRERSASARQAAEALFAPKPQHVEPTIRAVAPTDEVGRRPRVLAVAAATPPIEYSESKEPPVIPTEEHVLPPAHAARIRTWLKYGMTTAQVAKMYGVTASEVERVLHTV
jgi:hypothetical protein